MVWPSVSCVHSERIVANAKSLIEDVSADISELSPTVPPPPHIPIKLCFL